MKHVIFFLSTLLFLSSCQREEEEVIDIDQMVFLEEEISDAHIAGEPISSPQEVLIKESPED